MWHNFIKHGADLNSMFFFSSLKIIPNWTQLILSAHEWNVWWSHWWGWKHPQWTRALFLWNFIPCPSQKAHIHSRTAFCGFENVITEIECKKTIIWYWIHIKNFSLAPSYPKSIGNSCQLQIASLITWFIQFSKYALSGSGPLPAPIEASQGSSSILSSPGGTDGLVPIKQCHPPC